MGNLRPVSEIIDSIVSEMERLRYSPLSVQGFWYQAKRLQRHILATTGAEFFTEEIGERYLKESIGFPFEEQRPLTNGESAYVRCVRRIGEWQLQGAFNVNRLARKSSCEEWGLGDSKLIAEYIEAVQTADNSDATKKTRLYHIKLFYEFLGFRRINGVREMSAQVISDYVSSMQGGSPVYTKHRLATLRYYFRFLHRNGLSEQDWSYAVPKVFAPKNQNMPALWTPDELKQLLGSIDRGSPSGKRDYAIILLVAQLGLRIADVSTLRLDNLKWEHNELEFVQHKNGKLTVQPLLENVGWAIIDYLRYGRPKVDEPFVFLTVNAPYIQINSSGVGCILARYMQRCGITKKPGTVGGMHSLRHAMARRLQENGIPLSIIADIMGHASFSSTSPYLKVDIDGLRECALSIEEGFNDAK